MVELRQGSWWKKPRKKRKKKKKTDKIKAIIKTKLDTIKNAKNKEKSDGLVTFLDCFIF